MKCCVKSSCIQRRISFLDARQWHRLANHKNEIITVKRNAFKDEYDRIQVIFSIKFFYSVLIASRGAIIEKLSMHSRQLRCRHAIFINVSQLIISSFWLIFHHIRMIYQTRFYLSSHDGAHALKFLWALVKNASSFASNKWSPGENL